jgi:hypothetical protein
MNNVVLTLGGVPFQNMEVPEKISFGGKQRVTIQNLIGGGRVVGTLGLDDGDISFSGIFSGSDAVQRAQLLDAARAMGAPLPLVWEGFFYTVIVEDFTAEYRKPNLIPFSINCVVVSDPLATVISAAAPIANLVGNDLAAASAFGAQGGFSLDDVSTTSFASLDVLQSNLQSAIGTGGIALNGAAGAFNGAADADSGATALKQLSTTSSQLAALGGASGYVNRAVSNFSGSS